MRTPYDVVIRPIITETSMMDAADKKYTFEVDRRTNKTEIKLAIESIFDVTVAKVNTLNVNGKPKRQGRFVGKTASWKKAVITLTADSKEIEIFEGM